MTKRQELFSRLEKSMLAIGKQMKPHDAHMGELPCSPAQFHVLMIIGDRTMNVKHLAEALSVTSGAATQHVDALEKNGLLARTVNESDRREMVVRLTAKGENVVQTMRKHHQHMMQQLFENLTDEELDTMVGLMEKVSSRYRKTNESKETIK